MDYLYQWDNDLKTGILEIDQQHHRIIDMINELFSTMKNGESRILTASILVSLKEQIIVHFETEEKYMREFNYEGFISHKKEHDEFIAKKKELLNQFSHSDQFLTPDVLMILSDWAIRHIKKTDFKYIQCFKDNGL